MKDDKEERDAPDGCLSETAVVDLVRYVVATRETVLGALGIALTAESVAAMMVLGSTCKELTAYSTAVLELLHERQPDVFAAAARRATALVGEMIAALEQEADVLDALRGAREGGERSN